jgi:hypothetical protein
MPKPRSRSSPEDSIEPRLRFSHARTRPLVVETVKRRATKPKPVPRWRISLLKGAPAKFLGYIDAPDEKAAIEAAAKEYKIADALRDRIVARRDP